MQSVVWAKRYGFACTSGRRRCMTNTQTLHAGCTLSRVEPTKIHNENSAWIYVTVNANFVSLILIGLLAGGEWCAVSVFRQHSRTFIGKIKCSNQQIACVVSKSIISSWMMFELLLFENMSASNLSRNMNFEIALQFNGLISCHASGIYAFNGYVAGASSISMNGEFHFSLSSFTFFAHVIEYCALPRIPSHTSHVFETTVMCAKLATCVCKMRRFHTHFLYVTRHEMLRNSSWWLLIYFILNGTFHMWWIVMQGKQRELSET